MKRLITLFLAVSLCLGLCSFNVMGTESDAALKSAVSASPVVIPQEADSGTCGDNLDWSFDTETCRLDITGTGSMHSDLSGNAAPWDRYRESITTIRIADGVTSIGDNAFAWCEALTSITIPDSVTSIGEQAFYYCTALESVTIPAGVTSIKEQTFYGCTALKSVTIPDGVTSIGEQAFAWCEALTSITIPDSVTSIGDCAFSDCDSLTTITIPKNVTSIGDDVFGWCVLLKSIVVDPHNKYYSSVDGVLFNKDKTTIKRYPIGKTAISYVIPDSVVYIEQYAFSDCDFLTTITIPDSVKSISDYAFYGCSFLTSITIPGNVVSIGECAFRECDALAGVTIGNGVAYIGEQAFCCCTALESITIPDSAVYIGNEAFYNTGYYNDESNWEDGALYIGNHLIGANEDINGDYAIKEGTRTIGDRVFYNNSSLTGVTIPDSVVYIGNEAFYNTGYYNDESNWKDGVLYIDKHLIKARDDIRGSYSIKEGTLTIGENAFYGCSSLKSITIPDSVISIGIMAFCDCSSFKSVTIPDGVKYIGDYAFDGCYLHEIFVIPNGIILFGTRVITDTAVYYYGTEDEWNAKKMVENTGVNFAIIEGTCGDNLNWTLDIVTGNLDIVGTGDMYDHFSFFENKHFKDEFRSDILTVTMSDGVTSVGDNAFYGCASLTSITIPDGVTSIGVSAFDGCASLASITIPDSVTSIGDSAFDGCTALENINISDSVTIIGVCVFEGCTSLKNIIVPDGVASIGDWAFNGCASLTSVILPDSVTSIGVYAFYDTAYYNDVSNWECGVLYIGNHLIKASADIRGSIKIKAGTLTVNDYAFSDCFSLKSIIIPDGVTSIGQHAFYDCSSLETIVIPDSVTSIGDSAFSCCYGIKKVYYSGTKEQWQAITVGYNNEELIRANIVFNYVPEEEPDIQIDESANIDDFTAGYNVVTDGRLTVDIDGEGIEEGDKLTDSAYRGDGVHGWDDDDLAVEVVGAGFAVRYSFSFDTNIDVATIVFRNVYISENTGFGTLYLEAETGAGIMPLSLENGVELTNVRYIPVEGTDNYYNVVAEVAVSDVTELTLTLVTGKIYCLFDEIELYAPVVNVLYGDVSGDGVINSLDAALVLKHDACLISLDGDAFVAADVNGDGVINSLDAAQILKYDAKLITEF